MGLAFLMDQHVHLAITKGLRQAGVDVLTAYEDNSHELSDPALLTRATELQRILVTYDDDLLVEAHHRQAHDLDFFGLVYTRHLNLNIGKCIEDLTFISQAACLDDVYGQVIFLPL